MTGSGRLTDTTDPTELLDELTVLAAGRIQGSGPASWSARVVLKARAEIESLRAQLAAARRTEAETKAEGLREAREAFSYADWAHVTAEAVRDWLGERAASLLAQPDPATKPADQLHGHADSASSVASPGPALVLPEESTPE